MRHADTALQLRPMQDDDIDRVLLIEYRGHTHPWSERMFTDCLAASYSSFVLQHQQRVVGYAILSSVLDESHLLNICIDPHWQGQGLGRYLLNCVLTQMKTKGAKQCFLEVRRSNYAAISLYETVGFVEVGERLDYYPSIEGREDALVYAKNLA